MLFGTLRTCRISLGGILPSRWSQHNHLSSAHWSTAPGPAAHTTVYSARTTASRPRLQVSNPAATVPPSHSRPILNCLVTVHCVCPSTPSLSLLFVHPQTPYSLFFLRLFFSFFFPLPASKPRPTSSPFSPTLPPAFSRRQPTALSPPTCHVGHPGQPTARRQPPGLPVTSQQVPTARHSSLEPIATTTTTSHRSSLRQKRTQYRQNE